MNTVNSDRANRVIAPYLLPATRHILTWMLRKFPALATHLIALCCAVIVLSALPASASEAVVTQPGNFAVDIDATKARSLFDPTHRLTVEQVRQRLRDFQPISGEYIDFGTYGENKSTIWVAVDLRNGSDRKGRWIASLHRAFVQDVRMYLAVDGRPAQELLAAHWGDVQVAGERPVGPFLAASFELEGGQQAQLLVAMRNNHSLALPLEIATQERYQASIARRDLLNYFVSGAWAALILLIVVMGPAIGWRVTLAFVSYQLFAICTIMGGELYLFRWSWMDIRAIYFTDILFYMLVLLGLTLFAQAFFETRRNFPVAHKLILGWQGLFLLVAPYVAVHHPDPATTSLILPFARPVMPMLIYIAVRSIRKGLVGSWPVLFGLLTILAVGLVDSYEKSNPGAVHHDVILELGHLGFLLEGLLFAIAIVYRFVRLRRDHEAALQSELAASKEQLRLSAELTASQKRFERARAEAERSKVKVASLGHDLMQPLASLRSALANREGGSAQEIQQAQAALNFLEGLAHAGDGEAAMPVGATDVERFEANVVLSTIRQMFGKDAQAVGIELRTVDCRHRIECNPVVTLRIASNLVTNAIRHSRASRILIGFRHAGERLALQICDNGDGLSEAETAAMFAPGSKGADSPGKGLGLSIVKRLCDEQGFKLKVQPQPGKGMIFSVMIPRA